MLTSYGLLTQADARLIEQALDVCRHKFDPLVVLEIGVHDGRTSRGIAGHLAGSAFVYYGIENGRDLGLLPAPFEGARVVMGDSSEVFSELPETFHFIFVDGCHCVNHVMLDFLRYGGRIPPGGAIVFHDTDPRMQGVDYQLHGPRTPSFHVAVLEALKLVGLDQDPRWRLLGESRESGWGGARAYLREEG